MRYFIRKHTNLRYRVSDDGIIECTGIAGTTAWRTSIATAEEFLEDVANDVLEPVMVYLRHKTSQILYRLNLEGEVELRQHSGEWMKSAFNYDDIKHQVEEIEDPKNDMTTLSLTERACRQKAAANGFTLPQWLAQGPTKTMNLQQWERNFNSWFNQKLSERQRGKTYTPSTIVQREGFQSFRQKVANPSGVQGAPHCC